MLARDADRDRKAFQPEWPKGDAPTGAIQHRKILHIDMDAFFASVEQRDNPELRSKPVAVGAAASYEARTFGVRSAMPSVMAKRRCPDLIFVTPRFDVYKAVSLQIREIFAEYTPLIEPLSLDEAYLDVTENMKGITSATEIAAGWGREYVRAGPARIRADARHRQGLPTLPDDRHPRADCNTEGEVRRLSADHPKQVHRRRRR